MGRRQWMLGVGLAAAGAITLAVPGVLKGVRARDDLTLYVFVPTLIRAQALHRLLSTALPNVQIRVFARFADFASAVASSPPDAALTLAAGLEAIGLSIALQGASADDIWEPYVLLTTEPRADIDQLARGEIGVVDVVGRAALAGLVQHMLALAEPPRVRRVLKLGDLLPLLSLGLSAAVMVPVRLEPELRAGSQLALRELVPTSARLRRAALAFPRTGASPEIERGLRSAPPSVLAALGLDNWRTP